VTNSCAAASGLLLIKVLHLVVGKHWESKYIVHIENHLDLSFFAKPVFSAKLIINRKKHVGFLDRGNLPESRSDQRVL
jgi:hypothetical protein